MHDDVRLTVHVAQTGDDLDPRELLQSDDVRDISSNKLRVDVDGTHEPQIRPLMDESSRRQPNRTEPHLDHPW